MRQLFQSVMAALTAGGFCMVQGAAGFDETVRPFLDKNCVVCHSQSAQTAGIALDQPDQAAAVMDAFIWEDVKKVLLQGVMPPKGMPRPEPEAIEAVVGWIDGQTEQIEAHAKPDPGRVTARRLNRAEYNNTVQDLLYVDLAPADEFPVDDSGYGFDNIGDVLTISPVLMEKYLRAAGELSRAAIHAERRIPKPTVMRYQHSRSADGKTESEAVGELVDFDRTGMLEIEHEFPAAGDYQIRFDSGDRRPYEPEDYASVPEPLMLGLFVDGQQVATKFVQKGEEDEEWDEEVEPTIQIPYGTHTLRAEFYDSETGPYDPNVDFERRLVWADYVEIQGPFNAEPAPLPLSHRKIVECSPEDPTAQQRCAKQILGKLARRAYRRPVAPKEVDRLVNFVGLATAEGATFEEGLQVAIQAMLVSPNFLFRIERNAEPTELAGVQRLGDFEIASRLSYFLWSSMPDNALLQAAAGNELSDPEGLLKQVRRMLADERSEALIENFAGQWLQLRNLDRVNPDPELFPEFDESLRDAMRTETELFFASLMKEDRSVLDFLDAPYTFVNERLAKHYGIAGVEGPEFRRVAVDGNRRGGILSQASVLTVSSYPTRTSPVLRGIWVLENILNSPPPPPPPNVPELDEAEVGMSGTLREQLEQHRADPACAVCHDRIDPLGFGLENYDPIGRWREMDGSFPVDSSGVLPGGLAFESPGELKAILRNTEGDRFVKAIIEKMLIYALGRGLERSDTPVVKEIQRQMTANDYRFSTLVSSIVTSQPFLMRRGEGVSTDD